MEKTANPILRIGRLLKPWLEAATGLCIFRVVPRGADIFRDLRIQLPKTPIKVIFDVGANVGQSSKEFLARFQPSRIYCFEPVQDTFRILQKQLSHDSRVKMCCLALGADRGKAEMVHCGNPGSFFLRKADDAIGSMESEPVKIDTLDHFCSENGIGFIDFLKIDTEGSDLNVLRGAANFLKAQNVSFVQVEAGMNSHNSRHVPFEAFKVFLESKGYYLFGVYDQIREWPNKEPHLRRANLLFISERVIRANQG
jgi:FkbM family methyltransferase